MCAANPWRDRRRSSRCARSGWPKPSTRRGSRGSPVSRSASHRRRAAPGPGPPGTVAKSRGSPPRRTTRKGSGGPPGPPGPLDLLKAEVEEDREPRAEEKVAQGQEPPEVPRAQPEGGEEERGVEQRLAEQGPEHDQEAEDVGRPGGPVDPGVDPHEGDQEDQRERREQDVHLGDGDRRRRRRSGGSGVGRHVHRHREGGPDGEADPYDDQYPDRGVPRAPFLLLIHGLSSGPARAAPSDDPLEGGPALLEGGGEEVDLTVPFAPGLEQAVPLQHVQVVAYGGVVEVQGDRQLLGVPGLVPERPHEAHAGGPTRAALEQPPDQLLDTVQGSPPALVRAPPAYLTCAGGPPARHVAGGRDPAHGAPVGRGRSLPAGGAPGGQDPGDAPGIGGGGHRAVPFPLEFSPTGSPPGVPGAPDGGGHGQGGGGVERLPGDDPLAVAFAPGEPAGGHPHGGPGGWDTLVVLASGLGGGGHPHGGGNGPEASVPFGSRVAFPGGRPPVSQGRGPDPPAPGSFGEAPDREPPSAPPRTSRVARATVVEIATAATIARALFPAMDAFREGSRPRGVIPVFRDGTGISLGSVPPAGGSRGPGTAPA